jgi:pilus assembly protein Flp/PilA
MVSFRRPRFPHGSCRQQGQGLTEYALVLVLVALVVIAILAVLGPAVGNVFSGLVAMRVISAEPGEPAPPPPECYGSLLLPIMVAATGTALGIGRLLPQRAPAGKPA